MKIKSVQAWMESLPLSKPYTIAYNTISNVEIVFFEITLENGITGLGSSSPSSDVVGESPADALANLEDGMVQQLVGRDIRQFHQIINEAEQNFPRRPGTLAAIDLALHDAFCKYLDIPVADWYGRFFESLPTSVTIGIKDLKEMLEDANEYYSNGFRVLKIKTGIAVEEDIERVQKLHEQFGGKMKIRVDANTGYNIVELQHFISATSHLALELIEQPLLPGKESELLLLDEAERSILAADESLLFPEDALRFTRPRMPFGVFNIKLMKCGGIRAAREIGQIANRAGIRLFWGCNDESIISISAALHTAYSSPNTRFIDLDGSFDLCRDLASGGFILKDGCMYLTEQPGLGVHRI